ncbi:M14 family zinc carboxypeptidase [Streptomyces sp. BI20]|uniref:M14 family metallopeptidase n=1 Tax=Streptomyces sp. BI20 TaxID=3403460 RepID=UPI003C725C23
MRHRARTILAAGTLLISTATAAPTALATPGPPAPAPGAAPIAEDAIRVWTAEVTADRIPEVLAAGTDAHELTERPRGDAPARIELHLSTAQARELSAKGVKLVERTPPAGAAARAKAAGDGVFRPYAGKGGLKEEVLATAAAHPDLAKAVSIGKTVKGQDILALKVGKDARRTTDGARPSVLYVSNQHAREWITPEMTRRLMHTYLDGYGKDRRITDLVNGTDLWFVLSANPDGYDFTHADPANRQWRKNLRDNDGDGRVTAADGVDLNRNFPYKWGYDNEGSSPDPTDETYRGPKAGSEPETLALDRFERRIGFEYGINYHSAAQLLLYGVGWQVATPSPDDVLYRALAGTPENSAIPGYRPQLSSELYATNGEADGHAANVNGMMMFTPEMSTCGTASASDPNDAWRPEDCASVFTFPDDEKLIAAEFAKNVPFALAVAETAAHPDRPVSVTGLTAPDLTADPFTTSYAAAGQDQPIAVTARKALRDKELRWRINGGREKSADLRPWRGGERYGGGDNLRFEQYRAAVTGARPGDRVEVRAVGRDRAGKLVSGAAFTYTVAARPRAETLVVIEDAGPGAPAATRAYTEALRDNGRSVAVWDVARQGVPHPLGVLAHFPVIVHHSGPGGAAAPTQLALRDRLNEGGRLIEAGDRAGAPVDLGGGNDSDDFAQYWLGAYSRTTVAGADGFTGAGRLAKAGGPLTPSAGSGVFTVTSDTLPPKTFPDFASAAAGGYAGAVNPFGPYAGTKMAFASHADDEWKRLTRTVDLTGVTAADKPTLKMALSWDVEPDYDFGLLEAHTVGAEDWTTLPEAGGGTTAGLPADCVEGGFLDTHPFLRHYLGEADGACVPRGSTGTWNRFNGSSDGWREVSFDLSAYAGRTVELALSYVTDGGAGRFGLLADQARISIGGVAGPVEGFENGLGTWAARGAPAGSPEIPGDWSPSGELFRTHGAVTARDSVLLGFGLDRLGARKDRALLIGKALKTLNR